MSYDRIQIEQLDDDRILRISLDNPPHNVIDSTMLSELTASFEAADRSTEIQGMLLTSDEDVFCAGADVDELASLEFEDGTRWLTAYLETIDVLRQTGKPVVAAVGGTCVAGGNELVMGCDLIVASQSARFGQPEVGVGSTAAGGGAQLLPLIVGEKRAREMLLTGELLTAADAERYGLINRVVADGSEEREAVELLEHILDTASPQAYRSIKSVLSMWTNFGMIHKEVARDMTARVWASDEFKERVETFKEGESQRPRSFTGSRPTDSVK